MILPRRRVWRYRRFRSGLEERELAYVAHRGRHIDLQRGSRRAPRPYRKATGRPTKPRYQEDGSSLNELALAAGEQAAGASPGRVGTRGRMASSFLALRIRPARAAAHQGEGLRRGPAVRWLMAELPSHKDEPTRSWLSNLPPGRPSENLARLGEAATSQIEMDVQPDVSLIRSPSIDFQRAGEPVGKRHQRICALSATGPIAGAATEKPGL